MIIFSSILNKIQTETFLLNAYYLFAFTKFTNDYNSTLEKSFAECWNNAMINVNFLIPTNNESTYLLTTYFPFTISCHSLERRDIALLTTRNSVLNMSFTDIYPNKLINFNGCSITVATFPSEPFVIVKNKSDEKTSNIEIEGIDQRLLNQIAVNLNFTLRAVTPPDGQYRGVIYPNGTVTGSMNMVRQI